MWKVISIEPPYVEHWHVKWPAERMYIGNNNWEYRCPRCQEEVPEHIKTAFKLARWDKSGPFDAGHFYGIEITFCDDHFSIS